MKANGGYVVLRGLVFFLALTLGWSAGAQWITQTIPLRSGWNAVYLHVDASHESLNNLVAGDAANPIQEIWLWRPAPSTAQFIADPQSPESENTQWSNWDRLFGVSSPLQRLVPNSAYLVRLPANTPDYQWKVKGKPAGPNYHWTTTGLNLLGFPAVPATPPSFESYLAPAPDLRQNIELFRYTAGDLGPANPARLSAFRTTLVQRGHAYWVRAGAYFNRYFGPFELALPGTTGIEFNDLLSTYSFRLRNLTTNNLILSLELLPSEDAPGGQPAVVDVPPLLVRGSLTSNLTYSFASLPVGTKRTWTLGGKGQPGSEVEVVLGLNRSAIKAPAGSLLAGILRVTDSLGLSQIEAPVSAVAASSAGLWVGGAELNQVGQYLKTYQKNADNQPILDASGRYVITGANTNLAPVPRAFPLRLVLHNPAAGNAVLLQRVYCGLDPQTNYVIATSEAALHRSQLPLARRISCVHLPHLTPNIPWAFNANLGQSPTLTTTVLMDYKDQASNPFLHTYHPDHDNLDGTFESVLPQGAESYSVRREITLTFAPPGDDFASLTASGRTLSGEYLETITLEGLARGGGAKDARQFNVRGSFQLTRVLTVATLTQVP